MRQQVVRIGEQRWQNADFLQKKRKKFAYVKKM